MIKLKILILIFVLHFLSGCDKKQKNNRVQEQTIEDTRNKDSTNDPKLFFEKNLKEKPKLFLKFWSDMTFDEYKKVVEILIDENVLTGIKSYSPYSSGTDVYTYYSDIKFIASDKCYLNLYGHFDKDKLKNIKISGIECIYDLYKEKYNLPPLKYKLLIENEYIENNPNYQPKFFYEDDNNKLVKLPDAFYDRSSKLEKGRVYKNKSTISKAKTFMLEKSPLVIEKDGVVIIFEHFKNDYKTERYSLEESESLNNYFKTDEGSITKNWMNNKLRFIYTNSVLRTVSVGSTYSIKVTYMSTNEYNKELNKIDKIKKDSLEKEEKKKEKLKSTFENI
jgi:hypothetical protein